MISKVEVGGFYIHQRVSPSMRTEFEWCPTIRNRENDRELSRPVLSGRSEGIVSAIQGGIGEQ